MPRYFFDIKNNEEIFRDPLGVDMPDIKSAYQEAVRSLTEIAHEAYPLEGGLQISIWVADHHREPLFDLSIILDQIPAPLQHLSVTK